MGWGGGRGDGSAGDKSLWSSSSSPQCCSPAADLWRCYCAVIHPQSPALQRGLGSSCHGTPQILLCFPGPCPAPSSPLSCVFSLASTGIRTVKFPLLGLQEEPPWPFLACSGPSEGLHNLLLSQFLPAHLHTPRAFQELLTNLENVTNVRRKELISTGITQWQCQTWARNPSHRWMMGHPDWTGSLGQNECGVF